LSVKINGNRDEQQGISVSTKVSKETVPFQQEFPVLECNSKIIQLDIRSRIKTSNSDYQCC